MSDASDARSEAARKAIFATLVELQDRGLAVVPSRKKTAESFGITYQLVAEVEREGLEKEWPPL
jgi:hypothetical protein